MSNTSAYKRFLSFALVLLLLIPAGVKVTHHWFVHHEQCPVHYHAECQADDHAEQHAECHEDHHEDHYLDRNTDSRNDEVIGRVHKRCPICDFHFVEFLNDGNPPPAGKAFLLSDFYPAFIQQEIYTGIVFRVLLRGPPVHS